MSEYGDVTGYEQKLPEIVRKYKKFNKVVIFKML